MPQLMRMTLNSGALRYLRCPYQANVMKTLETSSSNTVSMRKLQENRRSGVRGLGGPQTLRIMFSEIEIRGHAEQHDAGTPTRLDRPLEDDHSAPDEREHDVRRGRERIPGAAIRPRRIRPLAAEDEHSTDGERVHQHADEDDVGVKLVVAAAERKHA